MRIKAFLSMTAAVLLVSSCNYLDIIPDGVPTTDMIYSMRANAKKQLSTIYGYIPPIADPWKNPGLECGDEIWNCREKTFYYGNTESYNIARGNQNANDPYMNYWSGGWSGVNLFVGIRECIDFINNIDRVPDMRQDEKKRWKAEAKVISAYLHFWLLQLYGPIPFIDHNIDVSASPEAMKVVREPVDDVVRKIVALLDEATADESLPTTITQLDSELGRITRPAALALKAKVLVLAASPLFNGNKDFPSFKNAQGVPLINPDEDPNKWLDARDACREAIEAAHAAGHRLYTFNEVMMTPISDTIRLELSIRNTVTSRFNEETIWAVGNNSTIRLFQTAGAPVTSWQQAHPEYSNAMHNPTLRIAELFYSDHGVPIDEDPTWNYADRYKVSDVPEGHDYYIEAGARTANLHYHREPRFYADLGFDRGKWLCGEGSYDQNAFTVRCKAEETAGMVLQNYNITGYFAKKLVPYKFVFSQYNNNAGECAYSFPIIRLADLYLMYAEAQNECLDVPDASVYLYVQAVRDRAGLDRDTDGDLVKTWERYSTNPTKPKTQTGMREIIRRERLIELALEGHRFYDLRRWKACMTELNQPIRGWNVTGKEEMDYYNVVTLFLQKFTPRDYFWPIKINDLYVNRNLIQNPMWEK